MLLPHTPGRVTPLPLRWDPYLGNTPGDLHTIDSLTDAFWRNSTVLFVGDSINNLVGVALECEVAKAHSQDWSLVAQPADVIPSLLTASTRLAERLQALHSFNTGVNMPEGSWWVAPLVSHARGTVIVRKGYGRYNATSLGMILPLVDVAIVNFGLHYGRPSEEYSGDMERLFAQLDAWVTAGGVDERHGAPRWRRRALFRETSAQHFKGTGSFRDMSQARPAGPDAASAAGASALDAVDGACACEAMSAEVEATNDVKLQNDVISRIAQRYAATVGIVPFYNLTAPRHDMHEGPFCGYGAKTGPTPCCDCTHLCYTPQLWRTWFHHLYLAFGRLSPPPGGLGGGGGGGNGTTVDGIAISPHAAAEATARVDALMERVATQVVATHHSTAGAKPPAGSSKPPTPTPPAGMQAEHEADDAAMAAWLAEDVALEDEIAATPTAAGGGGGSEPYTEPTSSDAPLLLPVGVEPADDSSAAPHNRQPDVSGLDAMEGGVAALLAMHPDQAGAVLAVLEPVEAAPLVVRLGGAKAGPMLAALDDDTARGVLFARNATHVFVPPEVSKAGWEARQQAQQA